MLFYSLGCQRGEESYEMLVSLCEFSWFEIVQIENADGAFVKEKGRQGGLLSPLFAA